MNMQLHTTTSHRQHTPLISWQNNVVQQSRDQLLTQRLWLVGGFNGI